MSYLADFFSTAPAPRDCDGIGAPCIGELDWLDSRLREVFGLPLREVYAQFIHAYALYGSGRAQDELRWSGRWVNGSFDGSCFTIELDRQNLSDAVELVDFERVSAQCIAVRATGFEDFSIPVAITVEMPSGIQRPSLEQLTVGVSDGTYELAKARLVNAPGDIQRASWEFDFPVQTGPGALQPQLVLFTNVADDAANTATFERNDNTELRVTFTVLKEYVSMGDAAFDGASLADQILAPFPIELDSYKATVVPGPYEMVGDQAVGVGFAEGAENPCFLKIWGDRERQPGVSHKDRLIIYLVSDGPIAPGVFQLGSASKQGTLAEVTEVGRPIVVAMMTDGPGNQFDFQFETGLLTIDSTAAGMVRGSLLGTAVHKAYSVEHNRFIPSEARTLGASFAIQVLNGKRKYSGKPYPCLK